MTQRTNSAHPWLRRLRSMGPRGLVSVAVWPFTLGTLQAANPYAAPAPDSSLQQITEKPSADDGTAVTSPPISSSNPLVFGEQPRVDPNSFADISAVQRRFQWAFRLSLRSIYDDNIFLRHENRVSDLYFAIEPGVTIGFGDIVGRAPNFIRLDYAPSLFLYTDNSDFNGLQHLVRLEGQYGFGRLSLSLSQDVQLLEGASQSVNFSPTSTGNTGPGFNLDAGGDTQVNIYATHANFSYDLTGKTFLSGGVSYTAYDYESLISSETLSGNLFLNYNYSPKLVVGLGGAFGYNWVDSTNPDQTFEQVNARMSYQISGKVTLEASAGVEFRQFEDDLRGGDYVSPVYELAATYKPFDNTTLTLRGSRRTQNSAVLLAQDYANTNITFGVRQRLFQRIYLGLAAGYENSDYFGTVAFVDSSRSDNYFFIQPAIDVTLTGFWTAGVYYLHRENDSSVADFSFHDNQFGIRTSLTF